MRTRSLRAMALVATTTATVLGLAAPAQADEAHRPAVNCAPAVEAAEPFVIFFAGEAHAAPAEVPLVSLTMRCEWIGSDDSHTLEVTSGLPIVTYGTRLGLVFDTYATICESAVAVYADGHVGQVPRTCHPASTVSADPGGIDTAPTMRCDHTRSPLVTNAWVVETAAVAGVRADVPLGTSVSCTLRDSAGGEVVASANAVGGVAVASWAERSLVASLASKCYSMRVQYFSSGTATAQTCESF